jgi:predicted nicotinamide N-methyase
VTSSKAGTRGAGAGRGGQLRRALASAGNRILLSVSPAAFVLAHTRLAPVPLVPEIQLRQAEEPFGVWEDTERELAAASLPPFWAFAWAGGQALARYLLDHADLVTGRSVLDVGSGSGLAAIAAARAGAEPVAASDVDVFAVAAIGLNARANGVGVIAALADVLSGAAPAADVVLAGDVCYERSMTGRIMDFLDRARRAGCAVLIGDPGRAYLPRARLEPLASYEVPVTRALEDTDSKRATVWQLAR